MTAAEQCFREALDLARKQESLFLELRVALSIAHVQVTQRHANEARQLLALVYGRFTEGFETRFCARQKRSRDELPP